MVKNFDMLPLKDRLEEKIRVFLDSIWKEKHEEKVLENWIDNYANEEEQNHMLYLLSKFMFFGNREIRELLTSIYRDFFKYPQIHKIRKENADTLEALLINAKFKAVLDKTRFLGIGNPSESGVHLLYYFRQQNNLEKDSFINLSEVFIYTEKDKTDGSGKYFTTDIKDKSIKNYIFIDDLCATGTQAVGELESVLTALKRLNPDVKIYYFMMFGTEKGLNKLRGLKYFNDKFVNENIFEEVNSVYILNDSFRVFHADSRFFANCPPEISKKRCEEINSDYASIMKCGPTGYKGSELMISFAHNTPDNTLPIFWNEKKWNPFFKRYNKI